MSTEITGRNFEVTPEIRQLLETKLSKIEERLFDDVIETRVVLDVQKYRNICEIMMIGKEHDVKAVQESDASMQDAINLAVDHAKRQAQKHREKIRDHHKNDATKFADAGERVDDAGPRDVTAAQAGDNSERGPRDRQIADSDSPSFDDRRPS
jgi:putative sigma-54 modulation protein